MSASTFCWVMEQRQLRHREFRVLMALSESSSDGEIPGVTVSRLAEKCELCRDQVEDIILSLQTRGVTGNIWIDTRGVPENTVRGYLRPEDRR